MRKGGCFMDILINKNNMAGLKVRAPRHNNRKNFSYEI